jgi:hypothetical protein
VNMNKAVDRTKPWTQQFFTVVKIGEEKPLTRPPWKPYIPRRPEIVSGRQEPKGTSD